jgi:hypothetical protein
MRLAFWIKRFWVVFAGFFVVLFAAGLLRGRSPRQVAWDSALWSAIAAGVFVATRLYHLSKGRRCELCQDAPPENSGSVSLRDH